MIRELKSSFVKDMEKVVNKMINGYYIDLCSLIDRIYYINALTFYGQTSTGGTSDSQELCTLETTTTTVFPICSFNGGNATLITAPAGTTTTTTTHPYSCSFNGGSAVLVTITGCEFKGGNVVILVPPTTTTTTIPTTTTTTVPVIHCNFNGGAIIVLTPITTTSTTTAPITTTTTIPVTTTTTIPNTTTTTIPNTTTTTIPSTTTTIAPSTTTTTIPSTTTTTTIASTTTTTVPEITTTTIPITTTTTVPVTTTTTIADTTTTTVADTTTTTLPITTSTTTPLIGNELQTGEYTTQCTIPQWGSIHIYTVPANTYYAYSLAEANQLALNDIAANGQAYADTFPCNDPIPSMASPAYSDIGGGTWVLVGGVYNVPPLGYSSPTFYWGPNLEYSGSSTSDYASTFLKAAPSPTPQSGWQLQSSAVMGGTTYYSSIVII